MTAYANEGAWGAAIRKAADGAKSNWSRVSNVRTSDSAIQNVESHKAGVSAGCLLFFDPSGAERALTPEVPVPLVGALPVAITVPHRVVWFHVLEGDQTLRDWAEFKQSEVETVSNLQTTLEVEP